MEKLQFYQKLAKAKSNIGAIVKTKTNPFFKSKYADINALLAIIEPELQNNGLIVMQPIIAGEVVTKIIDTETGNSIESALRLTDEKDPQKLGSQITYFRRYSLQSLLALQADDDDGNKAQPTPQKQVIKQLPKLTPDAEKWDDAKKAIKEGKTDIAGIRKHYSLTDENEQLLLK